MGTYKIVGRRFRGLFEYEETRALGSGTNSEAADLSYRTQETGSRGIGQITCLDPREVTPIFQFDTPKSAASLGLYGHLCLVLPRIFQFPESNPEDNDKLLAPIHQYIMRQPLNCLGLSSGVLRSITDVEYWEIEKQLKGQT